MPTLPNVVLPLLHMYSVTLSVHDGDDPLPPKGVFDWHYMQCVIDRFGTPQYRGFPDIRFFVLPFKTADDDDDDSDDEFEDDGDTKPPYPSYRFERFLAEQWKRQMMQERFQAVAEWSSGIPPCPGESG
jgi:hypothetical protein